MQDTVVEAKPTRVRTWPKVRAGDPGVPPRQALVAAIGAVQAHSVAVLGHDALEILCALIRSGCEAATAVVPSERPEQHSADLVAALMPRLDGNLHHLLGQARRALVPEGWILLHVSGPALEARTRHGAGLLRDAGFHRVCALACPDSAILMGRLAWGD